MIMSPYSRISEVHLISDIHQFSDINTKILYFVQEIPKRDVKALQMSLKSRMGVYTLILSQTKIFLFIFNQF